MENSSNISFTVANPAAGNTPVIYVNTSATLNAVLTNLTGADISLHSTSSLEIFMPQYFTTAQVEAMNISNILPAGWEFSYNATDISLMLKYTQSSGVWSNGSTITFDINLITATAQPTTDSIQVSFNDLAGIDLPSQVYAQLVLSNTPTAVSLSDVLQTNLDNQGSVFVSVSTDPLTNTLYLNFKNIGTNPLYTSGTLWQGSPQVIVTFVYGTTSGSLAPGDKSSLGSLGSAWGITGAMYVDPNGWSVTNPAVTDGSNTPRWVLQPNETNLPIIGTGDNANETFAFSNVISLTAPGHTQMYVQFTGFPQNSTTLYSDQLFVIDIVKQEAPATRGLLSFFSPTSVLSLAEPQSGVTISLRWSMYYTDVVTLITNIPNVPVISRTYSTSQALNQDSATITIPQKITQDTPVFITLQAYSGNGGYLNAMQFVVFISANFFTDQNGKIYPTVRINNQTWMAANLDYAPTSGGSYPYDNNTGYEAKYGRLYTAAAALANPPAGWRLPTQADWNGIINSFANTQAAYTALMVGGNSGFNAQLGGVMNGPNSFTSNAAMGYYWTSITDNQNPGNVFGVLFAGPPYSKVSTGNSYSSSYGLSVRYVKNS